MKPYVLILPLLLCTACLWQQPVRNSDTPDTSDYPFPTRVGRATSTTWFWLWESGDSSIEQAKEKGGIVTVSSITTSEQSFLGFIRRTTTTVRGN